MFSKLLVIQKVFSDWIGNRVYLIYVAYIHHLSSQEVEILDKTMALIYGTRETNHPYS